MKRCLAIATGLVLLAAVPSSACMPISSTRVPIVVTGEEAVIAYDARTGTEQFIRKAAFDTRDRDFGFLVPTPSVPRLSPSSDRLFEHLRERIQTPVVETKTRFVWGRNVTNGATATSGLRTMAVQVQATQRVGDFDAAVLKATDTAALMQWLKKHGYVSGPELKEWVAPYIRQGYAVTAFRIAAPVRDRHLAQNGAGQSMHLSPVCLTFQTPAPFYPYRESEKAVPRKGRLLRVYYMGEKRVTGHLGDSPTNASEEWQASTLQSRSLTPSDKADIGTPDTGLKPEQIGDRLTVFEDRTPLRVRKDLFLVTANDQSVLVPKRIEYDDIEVSSAVLPIAGSLFVGTVLAWWIRRRKG